MRKYIGITIGPIFDTILEASSPIALWFASNMFSNITARLCEKLMSSDGFDDAIIYSPYFVKKQAHNDGIGRYHDRIFFSTEKYDDNKLKQIIEAVKIDTAMVLGESVANEIKKTKQFFKEYLQIHYVVMDEEKIEKNNCILALSHYLDSLELMKTFPVGDAFNPIQYLFKKNENVKQTELFPEEAYCKNYLGTYSQGKCNIRKIEDIAMPESCKSSKNKKYRYFALVTADADNMSKFLEKLGNESIQEFSKVCLEYTSKASDRIKAYNGMTIYAGGDDLLFLAPVEFEGGKTVLDLCDEISKDFTESINALGIDIGDEFKPTVSFGISIQYVKFPLYEAIACSRNLLNIAKKSKEKNMVVVNLQKHSGQSVLVRSGNESITDLKELLAISKVDVSDEEIHSIIYTLENMKSLVQVMDKEAVEGKIDSNRYAFMWNNLFDNVGQEKAKKYLKMICEKHYEMIKKNSRVYANTTEYGLDALLGVLRFKKFLEEEGEEQ